MVKETLDSCKRKLTITVQAPLVKKCFHKAVENLRKIVGDMPGAHIRTVGLLQRCDSRAEDHEYV